MVRATLPSLMLLLAVEAYGQASTASQVLTFTVLPVATLSVSGDPVPFVVQPTTAGDAILLAEDRSTTYRVTSNRPTLKLSAEMDQALPQGMRLFVKAGSALGVSVGDVELSDAISPATVVAGIGKGVDVDQQIAYRLFVDAEIVGPTSLQRKVIFTLTD